VRARDAVDAPSAELLLYLAEFADAQGQPEDPIRVERELPRDPADATETPIPSPAPPETDDALPRPESTPTDD